MVNASEVPQIKHPSKSVMQSIVYKLKSVGALEMKFVAPTPEQIASTPGHFLKVPGELC